MSKGGALDALLKGVVVSVAEQNHDLEGAQCILFLFVLQISLLEVVSSGLAKRARYFSELNLFCLFCVIAKLWLFSVVPKQGHLD